MATFISWSGSDTRVIAKELRLFVGDVLGVDDVFMSDADIAAGARSLTVIEKALEEADTALVLVSAASQNRPWLNFEAGAISAKLGRSSVVPILLNISPSELIQPLAQFQAISYDDQLRMREMLVDLNLARGSSALRQRTLDITFDSRWPQYLAAIEGAVEALGAPADEAVPKTDDKLDELLLTVRQLVRGNDPKSRQHRDPRHQIPTRLRDALDAIENMDGVQNAGASWGAGLSELHAQVDGPLAFDQAVGFDDLAKKYRVDIKVTHPDGEFIAAGSK